MAKPQKELKISVNEPQSEQGGPPSKLEGGLRKLGLKEKGGFMRKKLWVGL